MYVCMATGQDGAWWVILSVSHGSDPHTWFDAERGAAAAAGGIGMVSVYRE